MNVVDPTELASRFVALLRQELSEEEWTKMCDSNSTEPSPNICHSHDFCDANEVMAAAWVQCGGVEEELMGDSPEADQARSIWGRAWQLAMPVLGRVPQLPETQTPLTTALINARIQILEGNPDVALRIINNALDSASSKA